MTGDRLSDRRFLYWLAGLTMIAAFLRIYGLSGTPPTSDDTCVVTSAFDYMERGHYGTIMWQHPKLRNILTYYSLRALGDNMWGLKAVSLTFGLLTVPLAGLVMRRILNSDKAALLAALFIAIDPVHIDFSRQAIQEVHMPFFYLLGIYAALGYRDGSSPFLLLLSGIMFGLGLAGKWYVLFPLFVTLAALALQRLKSSGLSVFEKGNELIFLFSALIVLPAVVYLLTYLPWFLHRGYDISEWLIAQRFMYAENLVHKGFSAYLMENDSYPALWFIKPVAFADFVLDDGKPIIMLAISNPFVWMLTLPANGYLLYRGLKGKKRGCLFLSAFFWCSYLPLALARRAIWVNTSFAVTPFAFMATAYLIVTGLQKQRHRRRVLLIYITIVLLAALPLYLLSIGKGYENPILRHIVELYRPLGER